MDTRDTNINTKNRASISISGLPIEIAAKSVSKEEFIREMTKKDSWSVTTIFNELIAILDRTIDVKEVQFTFNEILSRGTVKLKFGLLHHLDSELLGMSSINIATSRIMVERDVSFDVVVDGNQVRIENLNGVFAVIGDNRRRMRSEITKFVISNVEGFGMTCDVECANPFAYSGSGSQIKLVVKTSFSGANKVRSTSSMKKNASMRKFRESYTNIESLKTSESFWKGIKQWFAKFRSTRGENKI